MPPPNTFSELTEKLSDILDVVVRVEKLVSLFQGAYEDGGQPPRVNCWKSFSEKTFTVMLLGKEALMGKNFSEDLCVRGKTPARQAWCTLLHSIVSIYFQECLNEPDQRENGKISVHGKFAVMSEHEFKNATGRIGSIVSHGLIRKLSVNDCDTDKVTTQINLKIKEIRNNRFDAYKVGVKLARRKNDDIKSSGSSSQESTEHQQACRKPSEGTRRGGRKRKRIDEIDSYKENESSISEDKYTQRVTSLPTTKLRETKSETQTSNFEEVLDLQGEYVNPKLDVEAKTLFKFPLYEKAIGAIRINTHDVARLEPRENLNDSLVDLEFRRLGIENIPSCTSSSACDLEVSMIHAFPSCFYTKLMENPSIGEQSDIAYERVRRWTTRKKSIFEKTYLFFPIVFSDHWSVMCYVNPCSPESYPISRSAGRTVQQSYLLYFDSKRIHPSKEITTNIKRYLALEWQRVNGTRNDFTQLSCINCSTFVPRQNNAFDCGIFVMLYARKVIELRMNEILNDRPLLTAVKKKINIHIFSLDDIDEKRVELKKFCKSNYKMMDSSAMISKGAYCVETCMARCACPFRDCGLLIDLDDDTPECVGCEAKVTHSCANRQMLDSRDNGKKKQTLCVTCASRGQTHVKCEVETKDKYHDDDECSNYSDFDSASQKKTSSGRKTKPPTNKRNVVNKKKN